MLSTMQDAQLGIGRILRHMARVNGRSTVTTQYAKGTGVATFSEVADRSARLADALHRRGVRAGDRVASLMSASREHLEAYLGVPYLGAVLHTVNVRLHAIEMAQICNDAGDSIYVVDAEMLDRFAEVVPLLERVKLVVLVGDVQLDALNVSGIHTIAYETLLGEGEPNLDRPDVDERAAAILCHTGGTTGLPKGVAYSHRSLWLQAISLCTTNSLGIGASDRVLPVVPMFHVNGWGLPFAAMLSGADLILPGALLRPGVIANLLRTKQPTIAAGVPTIWMDLLEYLGAEAPEVMQTLKIVATGGAFVAPKLIETIESYGVRVVQAWGMTETSSMSVISTIPPWAERSAARAAYLGKQGRIVAGLELRVVDPDGRVLPSDGASIGEIQIRGPWVTSSYFPYDDPAKFQEGWLKTGDLGANDQDGFLILTDRLKDAIKSGGEWIPSASLEAAILALRGVREVAVIGIPDERWQERPLAAVVCATKAGSDVVDFDVLAKELIERVPRWWVPTHWVAVESIPRTSLGKIDKKKMRELHHKGLLGNVLILG